MEAAKRRNKPYFYQITIHLHSFLAAESCREVRLRQQHGFRVALFRIIFYAPRVQTAAEFCITLHRCPNLPHPRDKYIHFFYKLQDIVFYVS